MDAPCEIQGSIHVFRLVNNMCPGKWVHIKIAAFLFTLYLRATRIAAIIPGDFQTDWPLSETSLLL